jgi:hypothetical protein
MRIAGERRLGSGRPSIMQSQFIIAIGQPPTLDRIAHGTVERRHARRRFRRVPIDAVKADLVLRGLAEVD